METTFGKTVETRRLKSNHNRSNCSLVNLDTLNANADKINRFLTNLLLESNANNNDNNNNKYKTSNTNIYDSNSMIQFDTQLERINNELARAQLRNQLANNSSLTTTTTSSVNLKKTNSGYLSDSECYAAKLPSRLKITNRNDAAYFLDRSLNNNNSSGSNNNNNNQLDYLSNSNMKNSCINMQSAFKENNEFLLLDNNNKFHRSNLCLKLNRFNNIINNNNGNNNNTNTQIKQQQQYQNNLNILKQKKNEYYYNLIKTNQFNKINTTNNNTKNTNLTVNNNRSFRLNNNNNNSQTWVHKQENNSNNMSHESKYIAQLLSPQVRTKLLHNQRRSNETLSMLDRQSMRETNIDECESRAHYDSRNYLTWKNFNHNPETNRKHTESKINFEEELNQLKLKFKNKYVCDEYSIKSVENTNEDDCLKKEFLPQDKPISDNTPFLYNSYTLPKHSRFVDYKNKNEKINLQSRIETNNDQTKIEVVPLENALLNMNEILKNLTLNSSKKVNGEFDTLKSNHKRNKEATSEFLLDDKLKELSPPLSTSTSISLSPPPPPFNPHQHHHHQSQTNANQLSMSPSSSLSSSSYANSSKTSSSSASSSPCECLSEKSESTKSFERSFSLSISNSNQTACSQNLTISTNNQDFNKNLISKKAEKNEPMSFGKKLKRFLSINSGSNKKSTNNDSERFDTIKKKLFQLH